MSTKKIPNKLFLTAEEPITFEDLQAIVAEDAKKAIENLKKAIDEFWN